MPRLEFADRSIAWASGLASLQHSQLVYQDHAFDAIPGLSWMKIGSEETPSLSRDYPAPPPFCWTWATLVPHKN